MIEYNGYSIEYCKLCNLVTISLPPTEETYYTTLTPINKTRKIDITDEELAYILGVIYQIFEEDKWKK